MKEFRVYLNNGGLVIVKAKSYKYQLPLCQFYGEGETAVAQIKASQVTLIVDTESWAGDSSYGNPGVGSNSVVESASK